MSASGPSILICGLSSYPSPLSFISILTIDPLSSMIHSPEAFFLQSPIIETLDQLDQAFLDADFNNIMYEKYGKKWTEYQEAEVKRIEEEQLVSIDNVIFEPMPKRPYPRDKYIYEDENYNAKQDMIYLEKLGRTIERTSIAFILLSLIGLLAIFVWAFN